MHAKINWVLSQVETSAGMSPILGNLFGKEKTGSSPTKPLEDKAKEYPNARATGTATALPTWMYLKFILKVE